MPATDAAHSDQASRAAVRALTRPRGGSGQLPNTPRSLIAQAGPSDGTFAYSEAGVRPLGAAGRHPPRGPSRDRYGLRQST